MYVPYFVLHFYQKNNNKYVKLYISKLVKEYNGCVHLLTDVENKRDKFIIIPVVRNLTTCENKNIMFILCLFFICSFDYFSFSLYECFCFGAYDSFFCPVHIIDKIELLVITLAFI